MSHSTFSGNGKCFEKKKKEYRKEVQSNVGWVGRCCSFKQEAWAGLWRIQLSRLEYGGGRSEKQDASGTTLRQEQTWGLRIIKAVRGGIVIEWTGAESDQDMWCTVSHRKRLF